jgi:hypothetical protein
MQSILNDKTTKEYALLLLQEHCHYKQNTTTPLLHHSWTAIESSHTQEGPSRAIILNRLR